jgi:hypothetical protein
MIDALANSNKTPNLAKIIFERSFLATKVNHQDGVVKKDIYDGFLMT